MQYQAHIPMILTQKFIEKLGYEPENQTILVIRDFFTAMQFAVNNAVTFVTDDKEAYDMFKNLVLCNAEFGSDDVVIYIDVENNKNAWLDFAKDLKNMPKFDVAIMNPPYDRNLHLKILEKVIPIAKKTVNISPVRWLQDPFAKYTKSSDYNKFEDTISKKIETLDIIDAKTASTIFDAEFYSNLGIYVCGNGGYQYEHTNTIITKIVNKTKQSTWKDFIDKNLSYKLNIGLFGGDGHGFSLNYITCKTYSGQLKCKSNGFVFSFNSDTERENFYNCYMSRFMRWTYICWKSDMHIYANKVPYFGDYTKPWTTKMFCDYFDITGYIDDDHAVPGSEWETIMKQW